MWCVIMETLWNVFQSEQWHTNDPKWKTSVHNWAAWLEPSRMKVSVLVIFIQLTQTWLKWFILMTTCHDGGFPKQPGVISHIENWQTRVCMEAWRLCGSAVCKHAHKNAMHLLQSVSDARMSGWTHHKVLTGLPSRPAGPLSPKSPGKPCRERKNAAIKAEIYRELVSLVSFFSLSSL